MGDIISDWLRDSFFIYLSIIILIFLCLCFISIIGWVWNPDEWKSVWIDLWNARDQVLRIQVLFLILSLALGTLWRL